MNKGLASGSVTPHPHGFKLAIGPHKGPLWTATTRSTAQATQRVARSHEWHD